MSEQKIAEIRARLERHHYIGSELFYEEATVLLSELDKRGEENHKLHRKMIAQRQTTGALQKKADRLEEENRKLRKERDEARRKAEEAWKEQCDTEDQYESVYGQLQSAQQEIERLKEKTPQ